MELYPFQKLALESLSSFDKCALYYGLGLGKTFMGSEKLMSFRSRLKLIVCQKSKIQDWINHMTLNYSLPVFNLRCKKDRSQLFTCTDPNIVAVINYDLLSKCDDIIAYFANDTALLLDESSMIKNSKAKRTQYALKFVAPEVVMLSGTPVGGKYEELWTQCRLLGWNITKKEFDDRYLVTRDQTVIGVPFPIKVVVGYKNVDELKRKLREHGALFKRSEEVIDLPQAVDTVIAVPHSKEYKAMQFDGVCTLGDTELVSSTPLTKLLYLRMLSSCYSKEKQQAFDDLVESTSDRLLVFYNFNEELAVIKDVAKKHDRPLSEVNGKRCDLSAYENNDNSICAIQYQSGAMGLNLQKANKLVFYSPSLSYELYEQSRGRIRRIGQERTCFYWKLVCAGVEEHIYDVLAKRQDYTLDLFNHGQ